MDSMEKLMEEHDRGIDTAVDGVESHIRDAKTCLAHARSMGETGRELSLVMTKLDEAELWIRAHREKKEVGSNEAR